MVASADGRLRPYTNKVKQCATIRTWEQTIPVQPSRSVQASMCESARFQPAPGRRLEGSAAAAARAPAAGAPAAGAPAAGAPAEAGRQQRRVGSRGGSAAGVDSSASRGSKAQQQHLRKDTRNRCAIGPASRGSTSENLLGKSVIQSGDRVALQIGGTQYV